MTKRAESKYPYADNIGVPTYVIDELTGRYRKVTKEEENNFRKLDGLTLAEAPSKDLEFYKKIFGDAVESLEMLNDYCWNLALHFKPNRVKIVNSFDKSAGIPRVYANGYASGLILEVLTTILAGTKFEQLAKRTVRVAEHPGFDVEWGVTERSTIDIVLK